jgi:hypothetical protein
MRWKRLRPAAHRAVPLGLALFGAVACAPYITETTIRASPAKGEDCSLAFLNGGALSDAPVLSLPGDYEALGTITMAKEGIADPFKDEDYVEDNLRPVACKMGGDAVAFVASMRSEPSGLAQEVINKRVYVVLRRASVAPRASGAASAKL